MLGSSLIARAVNLADSRRELTRKHEKISPAIDVLAPIVFAVAFTITQYVTGQLGERNRQLAETLAAVQAQRDELAGAFCQMAPEAWAQYTADTGDQAADVARDSGAADKPGAADPDDDTGPAADVGAVIAANAAAERNGYAPVGDLAQF